MSSKVILFFMMCSFSLYGQLFQPPIPNKDIDSLINSIQLFELYKRANVEMAFKISFEIDESGETKDINYYPFFKDSLSKTDKKIIVKLLPKMKTIKWAPAQNDSKPIAINYTIPLIFFTINDETVLESYYKQKKNNSNNISLRDYGYYEPMILINESSILEHR